MRRIVLALLFLFVSCGDNAGRVEYSGPPELEARAIQQVSDLKAFAKSRYSFTKYPSVINIRVVPRSPECDDISFLLPPQAVPYGTNYDGSSYDRDGATNGYVSLCAAGRFYEFESRIEVTAEGLRTAQVVYYEMEHLVLYWNDRQRYEATKIHAAGGHPIL